MLLLDTCTLLWLAADRKSLSREAKRLLRLQPDRLFVCAISAFEIGVKSRKRALLLPLPAEEWYLRALSFHGLRELPVDGRVAARSTSLPPLHGDPCDRMIVAASQMHELTILTPDERIRAYPDTRTAW